jgi:hypothetical protein
MPKKNHALLRIPLLHMCPLTTTYVSSTNTLSAATLPHSPMYVSSYYYICVCVLVYLYAHHSPLVSLASCLSLRTSYEHASCACLIRITSYASHAYLIRLIIRIPRTPHTDVSYGHAHTSYALPRTSYVSCLLPLSSHLFYRINGMCVYVLGGGSKGGGGSSLHRATDVTVEY